jgi:hypothetical protein
MENRLIDFSEGSIDLTLVYNECEVYAAFTEVNKPVFHIEYSAETIESDTSDVSDSIVSAEYSIWKTGLLTSVKAA